MTLLTAYKWLLSRWSGSTDILVASPSANRAWSQTESMIGCFANMVFLRTDLSGGPTLRELLGRVRETALGAFSRQEMPSMLLVANFPPEGFEFDGAPYQAFFNFLNSSQKTPHFEGLRITGGASVGRGATDLDLALAIQDRGEDLGGILTYDCELFDSKTIDMLLADYQELLAAMVLQPERRLSQIERALGGDTAAEI